MSQLQTYTVLLLYPETDVSAGRETYQAIVEAPDPKEALYEACLEAEEASEFGADEFFPLAMYEGSQLDILALAFE